MANFDKKWSQLSGDESRAMKEKYGSRDAWQKAKSKAQSHQGGSPNGQALNNEHSPKANDVGNASKPYVPVTDAKSKANTMEGVVKDKNGRIVGYTGAAATQRNAERAENRKQANITNYGADGKGYHPETGKNQSGYTRQQQAREDRRNEADAYRQSRVDLQTHKDAVGRRGVYEYQSAKDLQDSKGGKYYDDLGGLTDTQKERNALIRTFRDSGYDYNHADVLRHMKGGKENKMFTGLYDDYGGYQNWYDNHSIYSGENAQQAGHVHDASLRLEGDNFDADYNLNLGNWTGSKDIMDRDEVLRQGNARQQAGKDYYNSDSYKQKYGQYDWAQNDMFNANSTFQERYERRGFKR